MLSIIRSSLNLFVFTFVIVLAIVVAVRAEETSPIVLPPLKEYRIVRSVTEDAQRCIDCHAVESKGIRRIPTSARTISHSIKSL